MLEKYIKITYIKFHSSESPRRWCSGNMKPFQGLASGSIPERRKFLTFCKSGFIFFGLELHSHLGILGLGEE
jgi:hypothetical protein